MSIRVKKTERKYPHFHTMKEYVSLLSSRGDRTLFRFRVGKGFGQLTYGEVADLIMDEAAGLHALGLDGKRVAVIGNSSPEWVATYVAVIAAGGVIVPMDKELAISEIDGFLQSVGAEAIVYSANFHEKFAPMMENHPSLTRFFPLGGIPTEGEKVMAFYDLIAIGKEERKKGYELPERSHGECAIMLFTSGTTGTSKCVMLSENNLVTSINAACETVEFFPDDTIVSILPLHHTYELTCILAGMNYGHTVGINDSLKNLMHNLEEFKPTGLVLVPLVVSTMYKKIRMEAKKKGKDKLLSAAMSVSGGLNRVGIHASNLFFKEILSAFGGRLNKIISGGAPLDQKMVKKFKALGIDIYEGYGITECSPLIAVTPYYARKPGSVGPAVQNCEARIAADYVNDKGFSEGEIQVRGGNVMIGYYNNDEGNRDAFTNDGWYRTGDIGYMDPDGYIYITGRKKSVIVLENGKNVFPEEMEEYLAKIPEIGESVVVGRTVKAVDDESSDTVALTAIVVPNEEVFPKGTPENVIYEAVWRKLEELNKRLPSFKKIKTLELRFEPFEKTTSQKIKRHLVK